MSFTAESIMTDYLKAQNERRAALMAQAFADWESHLRGWNVWDYAVSLEPVFTPIRPPAPQIITPVRDDARIQRGFGRLFGRDQITDPQQQISTISQEQKLIKPTAFYRSEPLTELSIILPKEFNASPAVCEQFFLSLSSFSASVSFEIFADTNSISIQFACDEGAASHLENQLRTFFPDSVINKTQSVLKTFLTSQAETVIADFGLARSFLQSLQTFRSFNPDPLTGLISSLANLGQNEKAVVQILFQKTRASWAEEINKLFANADFKTAFNTQTALLREKFASPLFAALVRLAAESANKQSSWNILRRIGGSFSQFSTPSGNELIALSCDGLSENNHFLSFLNRTSYRSGFLLNTAELASIAHLPSSSVKVEKLKRDSANTKTAPASALNHSFILGQNEHRGEVKTVSLSEETRTRHLLTLGATGSGKTNALLYFALQDIREGRGCAVFDVHGDLIDEIIANIPPGRSRDVVLFDPGDSEHPIGFNPLVAHSEIEKNLLTSDLIGIFRRFSTSWGDVMDSVWSNSILAFVESERGGNLFDLKRFLIEKDFRNQFLTTVRDEAVKYFWQTEFPLIKGKPQASILLRLDTFLRQKLVRNIVCQKEKTLNFRNIIDTNKIFLAKLSLGIIGEQNSYLLGSLLLAKLQQTALSRQNSQNRPFFAIYADEFHHLICPTVSTLLSGIRKFRVGLSLFLQQFRQIQEKDGELAASVLANCATRICFRLGDEDATRFQNGFSFFKAEHLQNLPIGEAIARIERADYDFNLKIPLVPKIPKEIAEQRRRSVLESSRAQFATPKERVKSGIFEQTVSVAQAPPPITETSPTVETPVIAEAAQIQPVELSRDPETHQPSRKEIVSDSRTSSHRYLQLLVKRIAENMGFRVTLEKELFGGAGRIDAALENENRKIAVEISVSNEPDYETRNIQKCLAAGYAPVVMMSADARHLERIRQRAEKDLPGQDFTKTVYFMPEEFYSWLENLESDVSESSEKVKGFKVRVKLKPVENAGQKARIKAISEVVFGSVKKLKKDAEDK